MKTAIRNVGQAADLLRDLHAALKRPGTAAGRRAILRDCRGLARLLKVHIDNALPPRG
jgi:hypothetical protein